MLSNAYFLAKFRYDTAENEPAKICKILPILLTRTPKNRMQRAAWGLGDDGAAVPAEVLEAVARALSLLFYDHPICDPSSIHACRCSTTTGVLSLAFFHTECGNIRNTEKTEILQPDPSTLQPGQSPVATRQQPGTGDFQC